MDRKLLKFILAPWCIIIPILLLWKGNAEKNTIIITNIFLLAISWYASYLIHEQLKEKVEYAFAICVVIFNVIAFSLLYLVHFAR